MATTRLGTAVEGVGGALLMAFALLTPFLRPWRTRWGATPDEVRCDLPGDELVPRPRWSWTHAVTIQASASEVWPWVLQIGQGRAGFYSYEFLENLIGCDVHNADRIIPELQQLKVGDSLHLHPKMPGMPVAILQPGRALVLNVRADMDTGGAFQPGEKMPARFLNLSWGWYLDEVDEASTRLVVRWRSDYNPSLANRLGYGPLLTEPLGFVMDRKMLLGIKARAERAAKAGDPARG